MTLRCHYHKYEFYTREHEKSKESVNNVLLTFGLRTFGTLIMM